jgi:predicted lactoylglutathione lyase
LRDSTLQPASTWSSSTSPGRTAAASEEDPGLDRPVGFFTQREFSVKPKLTNGTTAYLVTSEQISAILVAGERFDTISRRTVADAPTSAEVVVQLELDSREHVDELVDTAIGPSGQVANPPLSTIFTPVMLNKHGARMWCAILRDSERRAIAHQNWDEYWELHRVRMNLVRDYFPELFFGA